MNRHLDTVLASIFLKSQYNEFSYSKKGGFMYAPNKGTAPVPFYSSYFQMEQLEKEMTLRGYKISLIKEDNEYSCLYIKNGLKIILVKEWCSAETEPDARALAAYYALKNEHWKDSIIEAEFNNE